MANAKKCDRCGTFYTAKCNPDLIVKMYYHGYGDLYYDLCPKCTAELEKWLKGEKNEEN